MKVIKAVGFAGGWLDVECTHAGEYLEAFDFDFDDGLGWGDFTPDIAKAKRFADAREALEFWRTPSKVRPVLEDGRPNRPLTCLTVEIEDAP